MTTLTRAQAHEALTAGGWPAYLLDIMTAVGMAESSLRVEVVGAKNTDGTEDLGWLQINSRYTITGPKWDRARLLSDAIYSAQCGYTLAFKASLGAQGLTAWYGYKAPDGTYPHRKYLPPDQGGPVLQLGSRGFLVADLQTRLNSRGENLFVDGDFGPATQAAVKRYQAANPLPVDGVVTGLDSYRLL